ncbi:MAG: hypothetical protein Q8K36_01380, partial [Alphaproteobacteria bacterium]|nr:hypothetical protein [Alphaproteobacteria bacterium]
MSAKLKDLLFFFLIGSGFLFNLECKCAQNSPDSKLTAVNDAVYQLVLNHKSTSDRDLEESEEDLTRDPIMTAMQKLLEKKEGEIDLHKVRNNTLLDRDKKQKEAVKILKRDIAVYEQAVAGHCEDLSAMIAEYEEKLQYSDNDDMMKFNISNKLGRLRKFMDDARRVNSSGATGEDAGSIASGSDAHAEIIALKSKLSALQEALRRSQESSALREEELVREMIEFALREEEHSRAMIAHEMEEAHSLLAAQQRLEHDQLQKEQRRA